MQKVFNDEQTKEIAKHIKKKENSIKIYLKIMQSQDIDTDYKNNYINYYTMNRSKNLNDENYYNVYFNYLKELKNSKKIVGFEEILRYLTDNTSANFISPSYASKLLATIDPSKPVWDKNVLIQLNKGLDKEYEKAQDRYQRTKKTAEDLNNYISKLGKVYKILEEIINEDYVNKDLGKALIEIFNDTFKDYPEFKEITPIKKIDLVLWSLGNKKFMDDEVKK